MIEAIQSMTGAESIAPDHMGRGRMPSRGYIPKAMVLQGDLHRQVEALLYQQAALLDNKAWGEWAEMFSQDGVYWMPSTPDRLLMEVRMGRLQHPNAWSQAAQWGTNHMVSNIVVEAATDSTLEVYSRFHMLELRRDNVRHFAGSYRHSLVKQGATWRIKLQRVDMVNAQAAYDYVIQAWV